MQRKSIMRMIASSFKKNPWKVVHLICFIPFTIQMGFLFHGYFHPDKTFTSIEKKNLSEIEFPGLVRICLYPGTMLSMSHDSIDGYESVSQYFAGVSKYNSSVIGWAGHNQDGGALGNTTGKT